MPKKVVIKVKGKRKVKPEFRNNTQALLRELIETVALEGMWMENNYWVIAFTDKEKHDNIEPSFIQIEDNKDLNTLIIYILETNFVY